MHFRERFVAYIQKDVEVRVVRKRDSALMWLLNKILFFLPNFMENFTTTIGKTIYMPNRTLSILSVWIAPLMGHECQHAWDSQRWGALYYFGYLFPQVLALGSLMAIFSSLWWLLCLAALLPWPAPFRMLIERRGYLISLIGYDMLSDDKSSAKQARAIDDVVKQFTGHNYYFMWPFERSTQVWFEKRMKREVARGRSGNLPVLETTKRFIESQ